MEFSRFFQTSRPRPLMSSSSSSYSLVFLFILFITFLSNCQLSGGSGNSNIFPPRKRVTRQLGFGGFGGFGTSLLANLQPQPQQNNRRQQSAEMNFFQTMMSLNFDMTEVIAMYRNVTAVAETPGCLGHCRTPMALWVVQSFYPCYSLKKADCPKGLVCCMQDPAHRIASANTVHDTRIKYSSPSLATSIRDRDRGQGHNHYHEDYSAESSSSSSGSSQPLKSASVTPSGPTQSTTLFDEEYFKNNFIQDEIPE